MTTAEKINYFAIPMLKVKEPIVRSLQSTRDRQLQIINKVCVNYNVSVNRLKTPNRSKSLVFPRHLAMYLLRHCNRMTTVEIAKLFRRDHTTVLHATTQISNYIETNSDNRRAEILELINQFQS